MGHLSLSQKVYLVILFHSNFCHTGDQAYFHGGSYHMQFLRSFQLLSFTVSAVEKFVRVLISKSCTKNV